MVVCKFEHLELSTKWYAKKLRSYVKVNTMLERELAPFHANIIRYSPFIYSFFFLRGVYFMVVVFVKENQRPVVTE